VDFTTGGGYERGSKQQFILNTAEQISAANCRSSVIIERISGGTAFAHNFCLTFAQMNVNGVTCYRPHIYCVDLSGFTASFTSVLANGKYVRLRVTLWLI